MLFCWFAIGRGAGAVVSLFVLLSHVVVDVGGGGQAVIQLVLQLCGGRQGMQQISTEASCFPSSSALQVP